MEDDQEDTLYDRAFLMLVEDIYHEFITHLNQSEQERLINLLTLKVFGQRNERNLEH